MIVADCWRSHQILHANFLWLQWCASEVIFCVFWDFHRFSVLHWALLTWLHLQSFIFLAESIFENQVNQLSWVVRLGEEDEYYSNIGCRRVLSISSTSEWFSLRATHICHRLSLFYFEVSIVLRILQQAAKLNLVRLPNLGHLLKFLNCSHLSHSKTMMRLQAWRTTNEYRSLSRMNCW